MTDTPIPSVTLRADLHESVGPVCRSFGHRIEFEVAQNLRKTDPDLSPDELFRAADEIDDWREANSLPTTRSGRAPVEQAARATVGDTQETVDYCVKALAEAVEEGQIGGLADAAVMVRVILDSAARARRKQ